MPSEDSSHNGKRTSRLGSDDYTEPLDALLRDPVFTHGSILPVLGILTCFRTNSRRVIEIVEETFGAPEISRQTTAPELQVQIVVYDGGDLPSNDVRHICPDSARVLVHGAGGFAIADPLRREALIYASDSLVSNHDHFRHAYLEAAVLALVTHFDRHPVHAAALRGGNGRVTLLLGQSGSGKSTLAYVARANAISVLSEDIVWVQLVPTLHIWGRPRTIHLTPAAYEHFPELAGQPANLQPNGKRKLAVHLGRDHTVGECASSAEVCLLNNGGAKANLERVSGDEIANALMHATEDGFDRYPDRRANCARALASNGGWRLTLSSDPREAVPLLRQLVGERAGA